MTAGARRAALLAALGALLGACVHTPPASPLEPAATLARFNARALEGLAPELPAPSLGWDRSQWLSAALRLNPQLAEERAEVVAAAAAERTAAERPNPSMELFAEYTAAAAQSAAWLYGLSLDFLLRQPGERERTRQQAALQTALAQSQLAESIWRVRAALRQALLDTVAARAETLLLQSLIKERQGLLDSDRARLQLGDLARTQALIARPQIVRALREYDLSQLGLQREVAKRWPQVHIAPAYAWGGAGVHEDALGAINTESALGVSFELPLLNQHQGPIGEALARRVAAGEHLKAVQAQIYAEIDRAELAWPAVRQAWQDMQALATLAERQSEAEQRALHEGASDRASVLVAQITATEARLSVLEAAYAAQVAFGTLEDAYHRPLQGDEES
jgi:cobalt-zinc-cadmium efflux system outer membrane protein